MDTTGLFKFPMRVLSLIAAQTLPDNWKGVLLRIWYTFVIIASTFSVSSYFHKIYVHLHDMRMLVEAIFSVISGMFAWNKLVTIICNREHFRKLIDCLREMINEYCVKAEADLFYEVEQSSNRIMIIYAGLMLMLMVNSAIKNIYNYLFHSINEFLFNASWVFLDDTWVILRTNKLFIHSFFIDLTAPIYYEIAYITFTITTVSLTLAYTIMDGLFYSLGRNILNHIKILNKNFKSLKVMDFVGKTDRLDKLIDYHNKIIECCHSLNRLYFPILLMQFILVAVCVCLGLFQFFWVSLFLTSFQIKQFLYAGPTHHRKISKFELNPRQCYLTVFL